MIMERYSETRRDKMELELANRRNLIEEYRQGLTIIIDWLRSTDTIEMTLIEEGYHDRRFPIPNDRVLESADHPEYFAALAERGTKIIRPSGEIDG
jgi:hypothetical protein